MNSTRSGFNRRDFLRTALGGAAMTLMPLPRAAVAAGAQTLLEARPGKAALLGKPDRLTDIWGYGGQVPGQLLRVRQGERLRLRFSNRLPEATSVHWHGLRVANAMDGVAGLTQDPVAPGEHFDYELLPPDAGTYWYHPHQKTAEQLARGLYGALIVEEREPPPVDRELLLIFDDWLLDDAGQVDTASFGDMHDAAHGGRMGNWPTVNGVNAPAYPVQAGERLRLRLINAANSRIFRLDVEGHQPTLIALDGQPVRPRPLPAEGLWLAPGQRADLILDLDGKPGDRAAVRTHLREGPYTMARLDYDSKQRRRESPLDAPIALAANHLPQGLHVDSALRSALLMQGGAMGSLRSARYRGRDLPIRELVQQGMVWAFNGEAGLPEAPLLRAQRGQTVLIDITNDNRWPHAMHLHGHHFRVLARDGQAVDEPDWRDTLLMGGGEQVQIGFVADNPGKWVLHCHMLEHQAAGMVTWLEVA